MLFLSLTRNVKYRNSPKVHPFAFSDSATFAHRCSSALGLGFRTRRFFSEGLSNSRPYEVGFSLLAVPKERLRGALAIEGSTSVWASGWGVKGVDALNRHAVDEHGVAVRESTRNRACMGGGQVIISGMDAKSRRVIQSTKATVSYLCTWSCGDNQISLKRDFTLLSCNTVRPTRVKSDYILYHFNRFGRHGSRAYWFWPKSVGCPMSQVNLRADRAIRWWKSF